MERNYNLLDQFLGMECEVHFRLLVGSNISVDAVHKTFSYDVNEDDNGFYLQDQTNGEINTYIPLDEITEIKNLWNNDIYNDVVSIVTKEYVFDVCAIKEN